MSLLDTTYDVVIVGAGVAGALIASRLVSTRSVLLLDAGPEIDARVTNERDALSRLGLVKAFAQLPDKSPPGAPYHAIGADLGLDDRQYRYAAGSQRLRSGYEVLLGGSTWHWLGSTPRMLPADFRMHSLYRVGVDWPIAYEDLEPWYGAAEVELGVAGDHTSWNGVHGAYRSRGFPMSEIWPSYSDLVVERAVQGLEIDGTAVEVRRTPQARNSRQYDGRPPCAGNSSCVPICPIGAKYDASVHIAKATRAERPAVVRSGTVATRVELNDHGAVSGIRVHDLTTRAEAIVRGRVYVIAANGIESARLFLASGLAQRSGQVGRNLMDHVSRAGTIEASQPLFPFRGPPTTSGIDGFRDGAARAERAACRLSLGNDGAGWTVRPEDALLDLVDRGRIGESLRDALRTRFERQYRISASTEMLPSTQNGIRLLDDAPDGTGRRPFEVSFRLDAYTTTGLRHAERIMGAIFDRLPHAGDPSFGPDPTAYSGAGHLMGTLRMGTTAATSVVDPQCAVHEHPNLFVAGSSVFPTGGTADPTLTIAALALRLARHLETTLT